MPIRIVILLLLLSTCLFLPAQEAAADTAITHGMDVSHFQGNIDWEEVKQNTPSVVFVFIKATESTEDVDPYFHRNWAAAGEAGLLRGAYHYFDADADAGAQADLFIDTVKKLEPGDLPPWLDLESGKYSGVDEVSKQKYIEDVFVWLTRVETALGIKPIIYASPYFARDHLTDSRFSGYHLAAAEYGDLQAPKMMGAWQGKTWTFWQFSQTGKLRGIEGNVDLDRFNGPASALPAVAVSVTPQAAPETETFTPPEPSPAPPPTPAAQPSKEMLDLGKHRFPRDFTHEQQPRKRGVYHVKLEPHENGVDYYFHLFDKDMHHVLKELAVVIPRKRPGRVGSRGFSIRKSFLKGYEYFHLKVIEADKYIHAFFLTAKKKIEKEVD